MTTLAEFLLTRLDEDEGIWRQTYHPTNPVGVFLLADVSAKRRIVEGCAESQCGWILAELALPHADHADYRQEWRPGHGAIREAALRAIVPEDGYVDGDF